MGLGYKYTLTDVQAAIARVQLEKLDQALETRRRLARGYHERLQGLSKAGKIWLPPNRDCWHVYAVRIQAPYERDKTMQGLKDRGIGCGVHFPLVTDFPLYREYVDYRGPDAAFPKATRFSRETLSLPFHPRLTESEQDRVVEALTELLV